ncbi:MAG: Cof-type HAD-IIB family hydrolase [Eubacteriales bacterium]|nr:Cof-type HAD-IIB family hydrolase [Eubacteriales bacterium]
MKKKAVFFDIDGTLWDIDNYIPDSTKQAIQKLRANGHLAFLCSGRCRAYIQNPELLGIGFDGIVAGCGTLVEYNGETVFYKKLKTALLERTILTARRYGLRPILEGDRYIYMDDDEFGPENGFGQKLRAELGTRLQTIAGCWGRWEASKIACATENSDLDACLAELADDYEFMIHDEPVLEMVPKGFHKGTGIARVCELLHLDMADTFAFGDSANDVGMLQAAGVGVAMGNGSDAAKKAADYVTADLYKDGIWKACRHFELI